MTERHGDRPDTPASEPAPVVTSKARTAEWVVRTDNFTSTGYEPGGGSVKYEREIEAPAPTLTGNAGAWALDRRQGGAPVRRTDEPAHTMAAQAGHDSGDRVWTTKRPATTVTADARGLPEPGYRVKTAQFENAVRVTVEQAAALQTFPPDYPWQGSRTKQFEQVGNAVPPLLAMHVLAALTGREAA